MTNDEFEYEYPAEIKSIFERCEAGVDYFSNDVVSTLLCEIDKLAKLAHLGAAVSASPQPRCPKCGREWPKNEGWFVNVVKCPNCNVAFVCNFVSDFAQFFAAAPAQEPRLNATIHDKLQPCPFCGCLASMNAHGQVFSGLPGYRVECEGDCHAMTCYWHTEEQALTAWNRRAAQEQPVENSPQHGICGDCGADRSGPSAEAHDEGCPQKGKP